MSSGLLFRLANRFRLVTSPIGPNSAQSSSLRLLDLSLLSAAASELPLSSAVE